MPIKRVYFQSKFDFSTSTTLNTPVSLFSGGHTHPDTILNIIGNTYKYNMGAGLSLNTGMEIEIVRNRFNILSEILTKYKSNDNYISNSKEWDKWMETYSGNSPSYTIVDLKLEIWLLNSYSKYRLGPWPFDFYGGMIGTLNSHNSYAGWKFYAGIKTYFQGW